ncbi:MAG TPA: anti-sigma factor [Gaiellaceae bacterium]|nr:anti-sigma factor [Gaiellaceae bacterium]
MEPRNLHELTAAYALDALDASDVEAYEAHLAQCEQCRADLAELNETASALAWAPDAPSPPARLRAAILDAAAAERSNVVPVPMRRRWLPAVAAVAAAAAVALAVWNVDLQGSQRSAIGAVLVVRGGHATLTVSGLSRAPKGKVYEAWVIPHGVSPRPAGLFDGKMVRLTTAVPPKAQVAVTLEHAGGARAPTSRVLVSAQA